MYTQYVLSPYNEWIDILEVSTAAATTKTTTRTLLNKEGTQFSSFISAIKKISGEKIYMDV